MRLFVTSDLLDEETVAVFWLKQPEESYRPTGRIFLRKDQVVVPAMTRRHPKVLSFPINMLAYDRRRFSSKRNRAQDVDAKVVACAPKLGHGIMGKHDGHGDCHSRWCSGDRLEGLRLWIWRR